MSRFAGFVLGAAVASLFAAGSASAADYTTTVRQPYASRVQRLALAPVKCPRELDCPALEKALAQRLIDAGHSVAGAAEVRDLMTGANVDDLAQFEHRMILSEGLGVDAFVLVDVIEARVEATAPTRTVGASRFKPKEGDKHAALEVRFLGRDGAVLADAAGEAHVGGMRTLNAVTVELFETLVSEAAKAAP